MAKKRETRRAPGLGATYQAAKLGVQVGFPPAQHAWSNPADRIGAVVNLAKNRNYQKGVAVSLLDQWGSKKLGHAAALSRKSVTALAPEIWAAAASIDETNADPVPAMERWVARTTGFGSFGSSDQYGLLRPYVVAKYGLGIGRKLVNKTRLAEPIKQFLGMLGAAL